MALERAILKWEPDTFYFLSPNGELWLEVEPESFDMAPDHEDEVVADLLMTLEGGRVRWTRLALQRLGHDHDGLTFL